MANFKLNQGGGNSNQSQNTSTIRLGNNKVPEPEPEPVIEEPVAPQPTPVEVPKFDIPTPAPDFMNEVRNTPQPQPSYIHEEPELDDYEEDEEGTNKGRKKKKSVKDSGKNKSRKKSKKKEDQPLDAEEAYSKFRRKKIIIYIFIILFIIAMIFFGTYNTFFKHTLTQQEAAVYTNNYNTQTRVQKWEAGVQGYIQANLYTLLKAKFVQSQSQSKEFTVSNIGIEKNEQLTDDIIMSFFSADITMNGETNRMFMCLPLSVSEGEFNLAGDIEFSNWESYTSNTTEVVENDRLDFDSSTKSDSDSKSLRQTCQNFFEIGYNLDQDVSDIYKATKKLEFRGKFLEIRECNYYTQPNKMGYNAYVEYLIQLDNGATYQNKSYLQVEKNSSGSFVITAIL